jgi:membrane-associated phospholipid phosphatase
VRTVAFLAFLVAAPASAQERGPSRVVWAADAPATVGLFAAGALFGLIPVDVKHSWSSELLPFDEGVKENFSAKAATTSDALVVTTIVTPLAAELGFGMNRRLGEHTMLYGEALGANFLLNAAAKYLVQRPRPYTYNPAAEVQQYAEAQGADSHVSFYSGHSAMSFGAAVAGSYLFAVSTTDEKARATLWGVELALATATANLRVRAGKHFYSDILVGALIGTGVGFAVPYLHQRNRGKYTPTPVEWIAMGSGIVVGGVASQLLPLSHDVTVPLGGAESATVGVVPLVLQGGGGFALAGAF